MTFAHNHLTTGEPYTYWLEVLNFNGGSDFSDEVLRYACDKPKNFNKLEVSLESKAKLAI